MSILHILSYTPMKRFGFLTAGLLALSLSLSSCSDNSTSTVDTATQMNLSNIETTPGYTWYGAQAWSYKPDTAVVAAIKNNFSASTDKFTLFVKPSCGCLGSTVYFPQLIRVLKDAGVPEANIVVWSMKSITDDRTNKDKYSLETLPTFFIERTGKPQVKFSEPLENQSIEQRVKVMMDSWK